MAQPKKKTSHQKQMQRRARWKAEPATIAKCMNCGAPSKPHNICFECGYYHGRPVHRADSVVSD